MSLMTRLFNIYIGQLRFLPHLSAVVELKFIVIIFLIIFSNSSVFQQLPWQLIYQKKKFKLTKTTQISPRYITMPNTP